MLEWYAQIKGVHIACIAASGSLFALRGLLVQVGRESLAYAPPLRWLSYAIDTTLLTAAMMLLTILPPGTFANGWLTTKLLLVAAYVALGVLAMRRCGSSAVRRFSYVAAMLTYITIIGIARAHHPLGWLYLWFA
ncbi:SirB2 family protein [Dyella jiangningensis]|uniref:SirB2 family protein n=1 Tax=Dyella jiangningensis TaxID=1379159 RepID=UPI00240F9587|nr:SirB2 family protein [Dyella jiangningensis]MDG2539346.1 SirB2 family protein [Dyella jiangningensis]